MDNTNNTLRLICEASHIDANPTQRLVRCARAQSVANLQEYGYITVHAVKDNVYSVWPTELGYKLNGW